MQGDQTKKQKCSIWNRAIVISRNRMKFLGEGRKVLNGYPKATEINRVAIWVDYKSEEKQVIRNQINKQVNYLKSTRANKKKNVKYLES